MGKTGPENCSLSSMSLTPQSLPPVGRLPLKLCYDNAKTTHCAGLDKLDSPGILNEEDLPERFPQEPLHEPT